MTQYIPTLTLIGVSLFYMLAAGYTVVRRGFKEHTTRLLLLFLLASALWELLHAVWQLVKLFVPHGDVLSQPPFYGVFLLAFLYFQLTRAFLRLKNSKRDWWSLGIALMIIVLVLQGTVVFILPVVYGLAGLDFRYVQWGLAILVTGWAAFMGGVALTTLQSYQKAEGALHRNRIKYWLLALCFIVAGDTFLFGGYAIIGSSMRLAATLLITYVVVTYRLLNVSQIMRRILSYLVITLLTIVLYLIGFILMQYIFVVIFAVEYPLLPLLVTVLVMAVLFNPLLSLVQRVVDRFVIGQSYDAGSLVRQYSNSISNILSLDRLAATALEIIEQAMGIQSSRLFLVRRQKSEHGQGYYQLQVVKQSGNGNKNLREGRLKAEGVVAAYLSQERQPLTQYELDLRPRFKQVPDEERTWLTNLKMDVYVPIFAKNEWIGLFALGPKVKHKSYFDDDLTLLGVLADQTAVALQNARLVEDLVRLNKDLKQAYQDLDRANQQLKELDNLKSSFIGVVTHELRSPFINIDFSLQLIERYGLDNLLPEQREQLDQLKANVGITKQMVDNLVNFATFLSKQGELSVAEVDVSQIIDEAVVPNNAAVAQKQIYLSVDIPPELPPIYGDSQRLTDAVYQLVNNAVKFTPALGQIWIRCRVAPDAVCFEVQDTGPGIPPEKLPTVWDGFAQISDPLLRGVEGLGLGLTLVQYVANAHNGNVFAQSQTGVGSTFGFQIPVNNK